MCCLWVKQIFGDLYILFIVPFKISGKITWFEQKAFELCEKVKLKVLLPQSCRFFATSWTVACQAPLSWNSPGKNTGVGSHSFLQGILPFKIPRIIPNASWLLNNRDLTCVGPLKCGFFSINTPPSLFMVPHLWIQITGDHKLGWIPGQDLQITEGQPQGMSIPRLWYPPWILAWVPTQIVTDSYMYVLKELGEKEKEWEV